MTITEPTTITPPWAAPRDIHWIRGALQAAISIEHATMPLYSAAMYSLEVQNYPAYNTLRSVLMEEMLHMAAMCNALAAIGGQPRIRELNPTAILTGLPGQIRGLRARLAPLSRRQLEIFMSVESPAALNPQTPAGTGYDSIGEFYTAIRTAVQDNARAVAAACRGPQRANQVGGNLGYAVIRPRTDPVEQILASIDLVIQQGEGAGSTRTAGPASGAELSHYARFAELRYGRTYTGPPPEAADQRSGPAHPGGTEGQRRYFRGTPLPWPDVINSLAVPRDGYRALLTRDPNHRQVTESLSKFDDAYTRMLTALDEAWNGPPEDGWPALGRAVFEMNELRVISCFDILRQPVAPSAVQALPDLYPAEIDDIAALTDLTAPVYYGPRFENTNRS